MCRDSLDTGDIPGVGLQFSRNAGARTVNLAQTNAACVRLEQSQTCARSATLLQLLRFLIEHADSFGKGPKETYIGSVLYAREGTYNPRFDSIVRVNVKRLRARMEKYRQGEGKHDLQRIVIPVGSYRVVLETRVVEPSVPPFVYDPKVHGERRAAHTRAPSRTLP